jgi:hypothetical protein
LLAYQTTVTGPLQFPTEGKILAGNSRGTAVVNGKTPSCADEEGSY